MRITRRVDDFMIHVGRSARGETDMESLNLINEVIKKADIPGTQVHFGGSSQIISGKTVAEKTVLGAFSPERLLDFGLDVPSGGYAASVELGSAEHKTYKALFKAEKIKIGRKINKKSNFIILNANEVSNHIYSAMMPLHEISHSFSAESGLQKRDFDDPWEKVTSAIDEALQKPGDISAYHDALSAHIETMSKAGLEEARADSGALSLMVRGGLKDVINDEIAGINEITGYSRLDIWGGYEDRVSDQFKKIIENLHAPTGEEHLIAGKMFEFKKAGRMAAHTSYHANLQVPEELEEKITPLLRETFLREEAEIKFIDGLDAADDYRRALISSLNNEEKISMRVGDIVSHNFSSRGAKEVFEAHAGMVKPSLLPTMAEESISTAKAVIDSGAAAIPEMAEKTLEAGVAKMSRGGLKLFGSAAKKTSSRIIERNGNCS